MARWLHFTATRGAFVLEDHCCGFDVPGLFVYAIAEEDAVDAGHGWPGRQRVEIEAPADAVSLVQSFDDDEIVGERGFSEWFIPASEFWRCRVVDDDR